MKRAAVDEVASVDDEVVFMGSRPKKAQMPSKSKASNSFTAERKKQDKAFQESLKADEAKQQEKELQEAMMAVAAAKPERADPHLSLQELRAVRIAFFEKLSIKE